MYGINKYSELEYGENGTDIDKEIDLLIPDLMKYLTSNYQSGANIQKIMEIVSLELGEMNYFATTLKEQSFVEKVTWGVKTWEDELDIKFNPSTDIEDRREIIKAKLRGRGTTTKKMVKNTAQAFSGGEVDIVEYPSEFYFVVKFIGQKGIPKNLQAFSDMLDTIKPAHLNYIYEFILMTYGMIKQLKMTYGEPKSNGITYRGMKEYRVEEFNDKGEIE